MGQLWFHFSQWENVWKVNDVMQMGSSALGRRKKEKGIKLSCEQIKSFTKHEKEKGLIWQSVGSW